MPLLPFSKSYSQCAWSEAGTWYFWFIQCKKVCLQQVQTEGKHYSLLPESWNSIIKRKCFLFYKSLGAQISLWDLNELMGNSLPGKLLAEHVTPELHLLFTEYISYTLQDGNCTLTPSLKHDEHFVSVYKIGELYGQQSAKHCHVFIILQNPVRQNKYLNRSLFFFLLFARTKPLIRCYTVTSYS